MRILVILAGLVAAQGAAAQDIVYSGRATDACLADGGSWRDCAGQSADQCMTDTEGGETTVGMGVCLDREREMWDGRLNAAYGQLMAQYTVNDAENATYGAIAPSQVDALRAMQRAWIGYRDALCEFERAKWGGGTGGGPAAVACLLHETAEQTGLLIDSAEGLQ